MKNESNSSVKIRKMKKSHIPIITNIIRKSLNIIDSKKAKKDLTDQSKKLYVEGENFVAETNGNVIGVIGYWRLNHHPKNIAWLDWFTVDKKHQDRGIGSVLFNYLIKRLVKKKFKILICEKSSKDILSNKFYRLHKFEECGRIKNYWEDGGDLIILVRKI